jgi:hypothetical protein
METFLGLPPLQLVVEKEARQAAYRLHCSNQLLQNAWKKLLFLLKCFERASDFLKSLTSFQKSLNSNKNVFEKPRIL